MTTSVLPLGSGTSIGEFQAARTPFADQTCLPVNLLSATSAPASTLALTMTRFLCRTGEVAEPQLCVLSPTDCDHFALPSRVSAPTPFLPRKTYSKLPSVAGVLEA